MPHLFLRTLQWFSDLSNTLILLSLNHSLHFHMNHHSKATVSYRTFWNDGNATYLHCPGGQTLLDVAVENFKRDKYDWRIVF